MECGLTKAIKRAFRLRAAVEPVIGDLKSDYRMGRSFLAHSSGDAVNPMLAAAGYNFWLLLNWLKLLLRALITNLACAVGSSRHQGRPLAGFACL